MLALWLLFVVPALALTLDQALAEALVRNPDLQEQRARLPVAEADRLKAGQVLPANPELEGGWTGGAPFGSPDESEWEISLRQEFEIAGQRGARLRVVDLEARQVEAEIAGFVTELRADVRERFYRLLFWQDKVAAFRDLAAVSEAGARAARERFKAGEIGFTEQELLVLEHERLLAKQAVAEGELARARLRLAGVLGRTTPGELAAEGGVTVSTPSRPPEALALLARRHRADLRALALAEQANEARLDLAYREAWPNPSLSVGYTRSSAGIDAAGVQGDPAVTSRISGLTDADSLLGVRLSLPIPAWDTRTADKARSQAVRAQLKARRVALERAAGREVADAYQQVVTAVDGLDRYQTILPRYEEALRNLTKAYRQGAVGLDVLLTARDRLLRTRLAYLDLLQSYAEAQAALERAVGLPWPFAEPQSENETR